MGFIYVGPKDDFGYNQAAYEGSQAVKKAFPKLKVLTAVQARVHNALKSELKLLKGIDRMRDTLYANTLRFAQGLPANNALLWGARGMGKSSLVKAAHHLVNAANGGLLKLVEIHREDIESLPALMTLLRPAPYHFVVFCDDLSFDGADTSYKSLKAAETIKQ